MLLAVPGAGRVAEQQVMSPTPSKEPLQHAGAPHVDPTPRARRPWWTTSALGWCLVHIAVLLGPACHGEPRKGIARAPSAPAPAPALAPMPAPSSSNPSSPEKVVVPVIGCPSEGQVGPLPAPPDSTKEATLPRDVASRVSFYTAEMFPPILAPRGWGCSAAYGSDGATILVGPKPAEGGPLTGPAVFGGVWTGVTSGREVVAELQTLIFFRQYPRDRVVQRHSRFVEYTTPASAKGLGTEHSPLEPGALPVHGAVRIVGPSSTPDAHFVAIRLPAELEQVAQAIIEQMSEGW